MLPTIISVNLKVRTKRNAPSENCDSIRSHINCSNKNHNAVLTRSDCRTDRSAVTLTLSDGWFDWSIQQSNRLVDPCQSIRTKPAYDDLERYGFFLKL